MNEFSCVLVYVWKINAYRYNIVIYCVGKKDCFFFFFVKSNESDNFILNIIEGVSRNYPVVLDRGANNLVRTVFERYIRCCRFEF